MCVADRELIILLEVRYDAVTSFTGSTHDSISGENAFVCYPSLVREYMRGLREGTPLLKATHNCVPSSSIALLVCEEIAGKRDHRAPTTDSREELHARGSKQDGLYLLRVRSVLC